MYRVLDVRDRHRMFRVVDQAAPSAGGLDRLDGTKPVRCWSRVDMLEYGSRNGEGDLRQVGNREAIAVATPTSAAQPFQQLRRSHRARAEVPRIRLEIQKEERVAEQRLLQWTAAARVRLAASRWRAPSPSKKTSAVGVLALELRDAAEHVL